MKTLFHLLPICFMVANAMAMQAAAAEVQPGRYVRPHGEGMLVFKRNKQDKLVFDIESSGSNGSSCAITGFLQKGKAHVDPWNAEKTEPKCNVRFSATPVSVTVSADGEECATYCGVHADFIGTYVVPPAACTDASRQKQRERALGSYRMHRYAEAEAGLQTLLTDCKEFIDRFVIDQIRNDLALAQFHQGEFQQCMQTLGDTYAGKSKNEDELHRLNFLPMDYEAYLPIAKATWFNRALCAKPTASTR